MKDVDEKTARERLRRLDAVLDGPDDDELFGPEGDLPSPEETRAALAEAGIDMPAAVARIQARIAAFDGAQDGEVAVPGEGAPESVGDPAPVAGNTLPPPSTMTSGEVDLRQLPALRRGRRARKRRQIAGAGAATLALAAAGTLWWVAHPEEADLLGKASASATSAMGVGSSVVRAGAPAAVPATSSSASTPDGGTDRFGSGSGPGLRRVGKKVDR